MEKNRDGNAVIWQSTNKVDASLKFNDDVEDLLNDPCLLGVKPTDTQTGDEIINVIMSHGTKPIDVELWEVWFANIIVKKVLQTGTEIDISLIKLYE